MATTELVTKFSFTGSLQPLQKFNQTVDLSISSIAKLSIATGFSNMVMGSFNLAVLDVIDQQSDLAQTLGVSIQALQEWGFVATLSGSSAQQYEASLGGLSQAIGDTANDVGRAKAIFEKLGISVKDSTGKVKSADTVMEELRGKLQGLEKTEKISILSKLGIDRSMLQMLESTDEDIAKLRKQAQSLGITTDEEKEKVAKYKDAMDTLGFGINALSTRIAISLTPNLTKMADAFTEMLINNRSNIDSLMNILNAGTTAFTRIGKLLSGVFTDMNDGQKYVLGLVSGVWLLTKALKMSPIGKFASLVSLALIAIEDLSVGINGGESALKDFFAQFNIDILNRSLVTMGQISVAFAQLGWLIQNATLYAGKFFNMIGSDFDLSGIENSILKTDEFITTKRSEWQKLLAEAQENEAKMKTDNFYKNMEENKKLIPALQQDMIKENALSGIGLNRMVSNRINNNNQKIEINLLSDNPQQAGPNVVNALNQQLQDTNSTINKGGY